MSFNDEYCANDDLTVWNIVQKLKFLENDVSKIYYHGKIVDYKIILFDKPSNSELKKFMNMFQQKFPNDYYEFLNITGGLEIYGGYNLPPIMKFFNLEKIKEYRKLYNNYAYNMLIIGVCCNDTTQIVINLDEKDDRNIYVIDVIADDEFISLKCSFSSFLNRIIVSYGSDFWNW